MVNRLGKFYVEKDIIDTGSCKSPLILLGVSIQGQFKYFKEITIYFLRWEFTFGYDWEDWDEDEYGEV
jgi:hypothetical protein